LRRIKSARPIEHQKRADRNQQSEIDRR
jgi:hypothetical protein